MVLFLTMRLQMKYCLEFVQICCVGVAVHGHKMR